MLILRKIGKILQGKVTPFQLVAGCMLGSMLGFLPGFRQAPGLMVFLTALLVVLNANLFLASIVGVTARLLSLALMPLSFWIGRFLLDGPTQGIFAAFINAPILALFGFETYVTTGGLFLGTLFGLAAGLALSRGVASFHRKLASLQGSSERFQVWMGRKWVRFAIVGLAGGSLKDPDFKALLTRKGGSPFRPLGLALVALTLILGGTLSLFLTEPIVTQALRSGLERVNGATVDLDSAAVDLKEGRLTLNGLAMADPNALDTDLFRASRIEADISGFNLLRKRLQLDRVVVSEARTGEPRRVPGRPLDGAPRAERAIEWPDAQGIEDIFRNATVWKERLAQLKKWLDSMAGPSEPDEGGLAERLERFARERGYATVQATHLIEGAPTFLIAELVAEAVRSSRLPNETLDIHGRNLSTQPWLASDPPEIHIVSSKETLSFSARVGAAAGTDSALSFHFRGLSIDNVADTFKFGEAQGLSGGTFDLAGTGSYSPAGGTIDLPLEVTLRNTTLSVAGRQAPVSSFALPVGLTGSLGNPRIQVDQNQIGRLLATAGVDALRQEATERAGDEIRSRMGGFLNGVRPDR